MPCALASWHERLDRHFSALRELRAKTLGNQPIFALEHRLTGPAILELLEQIATYSTQAQISAGSLLPNGTCGWSVWAIWVTR